MKKITESSSAHRDLETRSTRELLEGINAEDQTVATAVQAVIPQVESLVEAVLPNFFKGGRVFYLGAGTSGRLGIVDASELPPTYGLEHGRVIGLIAGGDGAIRKAVEFAEDDRDGGWRDLLAHEVSKEDFVIGIAASGTTPYVVGALEACRKNGIRTGCITCNPGSPLAAASDFPVEVVVGPEFVTGSTRMKAGTAQKLVLNMISTALMIRYGRIKGNRMVDMQLTNNKLVERGTLMLMETLGIDRPRAEELLKQHGNVRNALKAHGHK